ncbi:MAG TPA: 6-phospho-beta-glucosidase, partial [Feifaniaceae bacterium]|nr:6-phospho-beta-glucosidase [Feifaniaceae bacterium]
VRTPFLAKSIAMAAKDIGLCELVLMDTNEEKLYRYGKIAARIASLCCPGLSVLLTGDPKEALSGADFIITTIRAGGDEGRAYDERTAINHGVLGQETVGAGGFAMALRSIPVLTRYCALAQNYAKPGAPVFNFTNPSGLVTQALRRQGFSTVYGVCDAPSGFFRQLHRLINQPGSVFDARCYGLNHLSWFDRFTLNGKDVTKDIAAHPKLYSETELRLFDPELVRIGGGIFPNEYLYFYYYPEKSKAAISGARTTRAELILHTNADMDAALSSIDIDREFETAFQCYMYHYNQRENSYFKVESGLLRPEQAEVPSVEEFVRSPDRGGYAAVALRFIRALRENKPARMVLNVPNEGAIRGLENADVVEISCTVGREGVARDFIGDVPAMQMSLIQSVKTFENLAAQAILEKSFDKAVRALTVHPLIASYPTAYSLAKAYIAHYGDYVGRWTIHPA